MIETGRDLNTPCVSVFYFENTREGANFLLDLVLKSIKKATASSYQAYQIESEEIPKKGDLSVVTDFDGNPHCIIENDMITIMPFKDFSFDIIKREGEDDCLETWVANHKKFFTIEGNEIGFTFSEYMLVVFEDFKVVYP